MSEARLTFVDDLKRSIREQKEHESVLGKHNRKDEDIMNIAPPDPFDEAFLYSAKGLKEFTAHLAKVSEQFSLEEYALDCLKGNVPTQDRCDAKVKEMSLVYDACRTKEAERDKIQEEKAASKYFKKVPQSKQAKEQTKEQTKEQAKEQTIEQTGEQTENSTIDLKLKENLMLRYLDLHPPKGPKEIHDMVNEFMEKFLS